MLLLITIPAAIGTFFVVSGLIKGNMAMVIFGLAIWIACAFLMAPNQDS